MKRLIKAFLVTALLTAIPSTVFAEEDFPTPEYSSKSLVTDEGLSDIATFTFEDGKIDINSKELVLMVNGEFVPYKGVMSNGVTFVPVRVISESFNKEVEWDANTQKVTVDNIELTIGSKTAIVGDKTVELQAAPFVQKGTTYVPLRFIAENLDKEVGFLQKTDDILIQNSMVWVEEKGKSDNNGKTVEQVKEWLQDAIYTNENFFDLHGNSDGFTEEAVENLEYEGQLGRYAIFDHSTIQEVILVDMENESVYFYHKEPGFSYVQVQIKDGEYYIYEAGLTLKLPEEFDGKYTIGSVEDEVVSDIGGEGFTVYHTDSNEAWEKYNKEYVDSGNLFSIRKWNKEYSSKNPPIMAGASYDLFSVTDGNYMIHFPSDHQGFENDPKIDAEYKVLNEYAQMNKREMRESVNTISGERLTLDYPQKETDEFFFGTWEVDKLIGFGTSFNNDSETPNGFDIIGNDIVIEKNEFSTESFSKYPEFKYDLEDPYYEANYVTNVEELESKYGIEISADQKDEVISVVVADDFSSKNLETFFYIIDNERLVMRVGDRTWYELKNIGESISDPYDTRGIAFPEVDESEPFIHTTEIDDWTKENFLYGTWRVDEIAAFTEINSDKAEYPTGPDIIGSEIVFSEDMFSTMGLKGYEAYQGEYKNPVYTQTALYLNGSQFYDDYRFFIPDLRTNVRITDVVVVVDGDSYSVPVSFVSVYDSELYMLWDGGAVFKLSKVE